MRLSAEQKPRVRVLQMGLYCGDELLFVMPPRFELRPGPKSPPTPDSIFIGLSAEGVYKAWSEQVEAWRGLWEEKRRKVRAD